MKRIFIASLCKEGLIGGAIVADDQSITYQTGKLTVSPKYRNLEMRYREIRRVTTSWLLCFPTVSVEMADGEVYRFIVFRRKAFCDLLEKERES